MKIHKILPILMILCIAFTAMPFYLFSQSSITSPYSRFGIGELSPQYNMRSASMGGIAQGVYNPTIINFANPASYSAFDTLSFLLDFAVTGNFNTIKSNAEKSHNSNASINYITIGMPIVKRWHTALGLIPISSVGYNIYDIVEAKTAPNGDITGRHFRFFIGDGAFNKVFWGNSFKITDNFAVGLNAGYMFGNSNYTRTLSFDTTAILTTKIVNGIYTHGFVFEPAIQYRGKLPSNDFITIGATYNVQKTIKAENDLLVASMFGGDGNNSGSYVNVIKTDTIYGNLKIPSSFNIGFSYERPSKFVFGADFQWTNWSKYELFGKNDTLCNTWGISLGGEIVPSNKSSASYLKRASYRVGFKTRQNIFKFNDKSVNEYAFTCGLGLPLTRSKTTINLFFEVGKKGTTNNYLIQENYFRLGVGLSLHEMWFYKRQYR